MGKVGQIIGGIIITVGGVVVGITTGQWGLAFAISAHGVGMIYDAVQGPRSLNEKQGAILENRAGARHALPVIYGQTRVGSVFADIRVDPNSQNNKRLVLVCAFAHGSQDGTGVDSIDEIYLDDRLAWTSGGGVQAPFTTAIDDTEDTHQTDHLRVITHLGTDSQDVDSVLNSIFPTEHPATSRGRDVCYAVLLMWYNPDIFGANIPRVNAVITGQKVFDPRTSLTAHSANSLLVLRDYLTAPIYGFGEDAADIDDTVLEASADYADELVVPVSGGGTQKRFLCNGALLTSQALRSNLSDLATSCRGMVVNAGGLWRTFIRRQQSATGLSITPSNVVEGSWKYVTPGSNDIPNAVMVNYVDPDRDYQTDTVRWPEADQSNPFLTEDGDYTHVVTMDLPFTDDRFRAQQIGMVVVREQREGIAVLLTAKEELLQAEIGDIVEVTHPSPDWTDKPFWVLATNYHLDGTIDLVLVEYEPSVYDLSEQFPQPTISDTGLPDPFSVAAPTGLTLSAGDSESVLSQDGVRVIRIKAEWTRPVEPFLVSYEIQAKRDTEGDDEWDSYGPAGADDLLFFVSPISDEAWDVQIRAVNSLGLHSAWVQETVTPDVTPSILSSASQEVADTIARYRLRETDQSLPLGLWGLTLEGDQLRIQKNTAVAGDFTTFNEFFNMAADGTLTLTVPTTTVEHPSAASVGYKATRTAGASVAMYAKASVGQVGTISNHPLQFLQNSGIVGEFDTSGNLVIGTVTRATDTPRLDLLGAGASGMHLVMTDSQADTSNKFGVIGVRHYTNAQVPMTLISGNSELANNYVDIGGGTTRGHAATYVRFYTAATTTGGAGTLRGNVTSAGVFAWVGSITAAGLTLSGTLDLGTNNITNVGTITGGGDHIFTSNAVLRRNTSDGSDTGKLDITGGGALGGGRGANVQMHGNEHATDGGKLWFVAGNIAGSEIGFYTQNLERLNVGHDGTFDFKSNNITNVGTYSGGAITATTITGVGTAQITGAIVHIRNDASAYQLYYDATPTKAWRFGWSTNDLSFGYYGGAGYVEKFKILAIGGASFGSGAVSMGALTCTTITASGNTLIGTTTAATGSPRLDVVGTSLTTAAVVLSDGTGATSQKDGTFAIRHYTSSEEPFALISGEANATENAIRIGRGFTVFNAATEICFYTAATTTTLGGSKAADITGVGANSLFHALGKITSDRDLTIGSLGIFDYSSTPQTDYIMRYNGSKWVAAFLQTQFGTGDGVSQINGDGTTSSFVYSNPSLSGAPSPNPSAAPVITPFHKAMLIDMSAYTLGPNEAYVLDYSINGGGYTSGAIVTTSTNVVHASLTPGSTYAYKFKVRGGSDTPYSSATAATNPLNDSSAHAFGTVLAADIVTTDLAAISADIGTITAGTIDVNVIINAEQLMANKIGIGPDSSPLATATVSMVHNRSDSVDATHFVNSGQFTPGVNSLRFQGFTSRPKLALNSKTGIVFERMTVGSPSFTDLSGAGTLAEGYGLRIYDLITGGPGITTQYGLKIEDLTVGGTKYAIYTGTGAVRFGGALTMAGDGGIGGLTTTSGQLRILSPDGTLSIIVDNSTVTVWTGNNLDVQGALTCTTINASGNIDTDGRLIFTANTTGVAGSIWKSAANGLEIQAATGSSVDFLLKGPGGATIMYVDVGTVNTTWGGSANFQSNAVSMGALTGTTALYSGAIAVASTFRVGLDGSLTGNTYIHESSGDVMGLVVGGETLLQLMQGAPSLATFGSIVTGTAQPRAKAIRSGNQTISPISSAKIAWNGTDVFDVGGLHNPASNNTRMTIPSGGGGFWLFHAHVNWDTTLSFDKEQRMSIYKNGTLVTERSFHLAQSGNLGKWEITYFDEAVATDYYEVEVANVEGANRTVLAVQSYFMAAKLW